MGVIKDIRILAIEDNKNDQELLRKTIKRAGVDHQITFLESPEDVMVQKIGEKDLPYDLIILDYFFPNNMVSTNFLHTLRKLWHSKVPVIFFTGSESEVVKTNISSYKNVHHLLKSSENYQKLVPLILELTD